jgi:hypothetical protein
LPLPTSVRTDALIAAVLVAGIAAAASEIVVLRRGAPLAEPSGRPIQAPADQYVSSDTCRACHPSQYASWYRSYHRTMTTAASSDTIHADFADTVVDAARGMPAAALPEPGMHLSHVRDRFTAEFQDPDEPGRRISRDIVLVTGSHQQQVYWYATGQSRVIGQLPSMYLLNEHTWIPRTAAFLRPPADRAGSETGRWNGVCVNCHATHGEWRLSSIEGGVSLAPRQADTHVAEFGIACEACHGPGDSHVRINTNPLRRYLLHWSGSNDPTIVQPARLRASVSSDVCGQCHSVWNYYSKEDEAAANQAGLPFRPGDALARTRFLVRPAVDRSSPILSRLLSVDPGLVDGSFWPDGMIRVSGREYSGLIESPCYRDAPDDSRRMTCFSCHTMHKADDDARSADEWADTHQTSPGRDGSGACLSCHPSIGTNVQAHTHHSAGSDGSNCLNCHMPYTTYGLLRALRSHQVSSPSIATSVTTGRPNACNLCHLDKTLAWSDAHLADWYATKRTALDQDQGSVAASLLWLLEGDAGQRAITAWSYGWTPAQRASHTDWMTPFLAGLLDDPYDAVRFIAGRSLMSIPMYSHLPYDFMAPAATRQAAAAETLRLWQRNAARTRDSALLFDGNGNLDGVTLTRLLSTRNNRRIALRE